jgi:hypothetical protein
MTTTNRSTSRVVLIACCLSSISLCGGALATSGPPSPFNNESEVVKRPEDARALSQVKGFLEYLQTLAPVVTNPKSEDQDVSASCAI